MPDWFTETNSSPMPPNAVSKWRQLVFESGVNTLGDGSLNLKYDGEVGLFVFWLFAILHERNRAFFPWLQTTRCLLCLILWLDFVPVGSHFHEATTKVSPCKITFTNYNSHSLSPIHHLYVSWIFLDWLFLHYIFNMRKWCHMLTRHRYTSHHMYKVKLGFLWIELRNKGSSGDAEVFVRSIQRQKYLTLSNTNLHQRNTLRFPGHCGLAKKVI